MRTLKLARKTTRSLLLLSGVLTAVAGGGAARAEERLSLERMREAVCASADANGETVRPFVCDARCDCAPTDPAAPMLPDVDACTESAAGVVTATATLVNTPTCQGACPGDWILACNGATSVAIPTSFTPCDSGATCSTGTCDPPQTIFDPCSGQSIQVRFCSNTGVTTCSSNADCTIPCSYSLPDPLGGGSVELGQCRDVACTTSADCGAGYACNAGVCSVACTEGSTCPTATSVRQVLQLDALLPPDDPGVVTCSAGEMDPTVTGINSNDALECLAQIESAAGQACTPVP